MNTYQLYRGDGTNLVFPITLDYKDDTDYITVKKVNSSGVETTLTYTTHYTISDSAVNIVDGNEPSATEFLLIELNSDYLQSLDLADNSAFEAENFEDQLDKLAITFQRIKYDLDRSVLSVLAGTDTALIGTLAVQDADDVLISGGSITGVGTWPVIDGGTGSTTASAARTALGITGDMALQSAASVAITGGTIDAATLDLNGATTDGSPNKAADYIFTLDATGPSYKKVLLNDIPTPNFELSKDSTPQLAGDLDLNSNGIAFPSVTITDCLDEDNMASNSATAVATQQSIKAYVDTQAATVPDPEGIIHCVCTETITLASGGPDTDYFSFRASDSTNDAHQLYIPVSGTLSDFYLTVYLTSTITGTTNSFQALVTNGTSTIDIDGGLATVGTAGIYTQTNTSGSLSVSAGDYLRISLGYTSGTRSANANLRASFSCVLTPN